MQDLTRKLIRHIIAYGKIALNEDAKKGKVFLYYTNIPR